MARNGLLVIPRSRTKRTRRVRLPVWAHPTNAERDYRRLLLQLVSALRSKLAEQLLPRLQDLIQEAELLRPTRSDGWVESLDALMTVIRMSLSQDELVAQMGVREVAERVSTFNRSQLSKITNAALGVDVILEEPWLRDALAAFTKENVALIKSIPRQALEQVEADVQRAFRSGQRASELAKELRRLIDKRVNNAEARARLIARDQVAKLNGNLTQLRQRELGVERYVWHTSQDERVRESHRAKDGKVYSWDDPPATGHPGEDIQCRCWAEPDLSHLL